MKNITTNATTNDNPYVLKAPLNATASPLKRGIHDSKNLKPSTIGIIKLKCNKVVQPIALTKSFAPSLDSAYLF